MRIGIFHGYELTGSGSNEYTRYLARALAAQGHTVHLLCREPRPQVLEFVSRAEEWSADGTSRVLFEREVQGPGQTVVHVLPHASVKPVYLTDKQRSGNVKSFASLSDDELQEYHDLNVRVVTGVLSANRLDILHANHVIYQPVAAVEACRATGTPLVVYPHGSAIEYTVRADERYERLAGEALLAADGMIVGNREVEGRLLRLYSDHRDELIERSQIVGVGVDTALFRPLEKSERSASFAELAGMGPFVGKSGAQKLELHDRLCAGDWDAVCGYWSAYDHSAPDADLAESLGRIDLDRPLLLFVGALTAGKGLQSLIAALPKVQQRCPGTQLAIVGSGAYREVLEAFVYALDRGDAKLARHLAAHGFDLDRSDMSGPWADVQAMFESPAGLELLEGCKGLGDRVHFLGRLDHRRLCRLFPCADVAVFPSLVPEAYPLVLMESLANGVLPAVTDFSGFADGLENLVPHLGADRVDRMRLPLETDRRISGIASSLSGLLCDAELAAIRPHLRAVAVEHYDWGVRAQQMTAAYAAVCARARTADSQTSKNQTPTADSPISD